jgi:hypothetical protein
VYFSLDAKKFEQQGPMLWFSQIFGEKNVPYFKPNFIIHYWRKAAVFWVKIALFSSIFGKNSSMITTLKPKIYFNSVKKMATAKMSLRVKIGMRPLNLWCRDNHIFLLLKMPCVEFCLDHKNSLFRFLKPTTLGSNTLAVFNLQTLYYKIGHAIEVCT